MYNYTSVHVFQWLLGFIAVVVDQDFENQWNTALSGINSFFTKLSFFLGSWTNLWSRHAIWLGTKDFQVMELDCKVFLDMFSEKGRIGEVLLLQKLVSVWCNHLSSKRGWCVPEWHIYDGWMFFWGCVSVSKCLIFLGALKTNASWICNVLLFAYYFLAIFWHWYLLTIIMFFLCTFHPKNWL